MRIWSPSDGASERAAPERDTASELLRRLSLGDWVRIWLTMLPRHLPRRLARQVQSMNTALAVRSVLASMFLGFPVWLLLVMVLLPDTAAARLWSGVSAVAFTVIALMMWIFGRMQARGALSAARFNILVLPCTVTAALAWGALPGVVGPYPIDLFYVTAAMVVFVAILGVVFHAGHWPIAMMYSVIIAGVTSATFYRFDRPEANVSTAIIFVSVTTVFVLSVVGCITLVRIQLQTVLAEDRQLTIDLLLNSYERSGNDWVWGVDEDTIFYSVPERMSVAGRGDPRVQPGHSLLELVQDDPAATAAIRASESFEAAFKTEGPEGRGEIQLWGRPVVVDGRCLGFRGVGSDLGATKRAADAERRAERFDAMVSVTSGINHDFNNQLATVLSAVELARMWVSRFDGPVEYLDRAVEACMRSRSLTADLAAALGLRTPSKAAPFDLVAETQHVIDDVAQVYPDMSIRLVGTGPVVAVADPGHVRRAVRNLVENACQANERCGESARVVTVQVSTVDSGDGERACVRVTDEGPGISEDVLDRMFEPFFTTRSADGGTGLGLAVANGLTRQAGGSLQYKSAEGGTTFELLLPSGAQEVPIAESGSGGPAEVTLCEGAYLVVEDDDMVATMLVDWIETNGSKATWVSTVAEGVELATDHRDRFACLITDILLPDGEGFDVAAVYRRHNPEAPVVYMSGFSRTLPTDLDVLLHGPFVSKPFAFDELVHALTAAGVVKKALVGQPNDRG